MSRYGLEAANPTKTGPTLIPELTVKRPSKSKTSIALKLKKIKQKSPAKIKRRPTFNEIEKTPKRRH